MEKVEKKECVAAILSETEIIINIGKNKNVKISDRFLILDSENGIPISDPFTGEHLGTIPNIKHEIEVSKIYDKMAVCRIYQKQNPLEAINRNPFNTPKTFKYSGQTIMSNQVKTNTMVRIGDIIERV